MKKILTILLFLLFSLHNAAFAGSTGDPWSHMLTSGTPIATKVLGDQVTVQFEIGQDTWTASSVGFGTNATDVSAWTWTTAVWFNNGSGSNKQVQGTLTLSLTGTVYVNGRVVDVVTHYANSITWDHSGTPNAAYYYTVNSLSNPSAQSAAYNATYSISQIDLSWTKDASSHNVMVVRREGAAVDFTPTQGTAYTDGQTVGNCTVVKGSSASTSVADQGLKPGVTYYYKFYSENNSYYSDGVTANATTQTTVPAPLAVMAGGYSSTQNNPIWVPANSTYDSVIVIAGTADMTADPTNGIKLAVSDVVGGGTVIYKGNAKNCTHTGLSSSNTYYYRFYTVYKNYYSATSSYTKAQYQPFDQPTIDGSFSENNYQVLGSSTSGNQSFGSGDKLGSLYYYSNGTDFYVGIAGITSSTNNIVVFMDFEGCTGRAASTTLAGSATSSSGVFTTTNGGLDGAKMDFEVDYALAFNTGGGTTEYFCDAAKFNSSGYSATGYFGKATSQSGVSASVSTATIFGGTGNLTFAFRNTYDATNHPTHGLEFKLPLTAIPEVDFTKNVRFFVLLTGQTGFASNVCIPGNPGATSPGSDFNFPGVSGQTFHTGLKPLPIEMISVNATKISNGVLLKWATASEFNNHGFTVLRSSDKKNWTSLDFISGAGNSNSPKSYSYTDRNVSAGTWYYMLRQTDNDGSSEDFQVLEINVAKPLKYDLEQNYPNPFNPATKISYSTPAAGNVTLTLFNALGQKVKVLYNGYADAGIHSCTLSAENLQSGVYYYKLEAGDFSQVKKLVVLK